MIFFGSGGGIPLNFKVVGGTTAPASPKENTIWINTDKAITRWDFSATEPKKVSGNRNLLVYPYPEDTQTTAGVAYTVNSDGSITANGTATANSVQYIAYREKSVLLLPAGSYRLSGCPAGGSSATYFLEAAVSYDDWVTVSAYPKDSGTGTTVTLTAPAKVSVYVKVVSGTTVNNLIFKPQLEKGSTATSFVKGDATGQVWITTGTASGVEFNALKKNGLQVYPISAKQYISGAWVDKTAKSYQNGAWVDWILYLYNYGEENTALMGEFTSKGTNNGGGGAQTPTVTKGSTTITVKLSSDYKGGIAYWPNPVDLSAFKTLRFKGTLQAQDLGSHTGSANWAKLCVWSTIPLSNDTNQVVTASPDSSKIAYDLSLDVASLSGEYYIGFDLYHSATVVIEKIWLE